MRTNDMDKMKKYQKVIRDISPEFKNVPFPVIVESSTEFKVIPIDKKNDRAIIEDISYIADTISNRYYKNPINRVLYKTVIGTTPKSFRPNEVGKILEYEIPNILSKFKTIAQIIPLKQVGYPDIKIIENSGRTVFVDIKATTRPNVGSPRDFYYSTKEMTIKKINNDGVHLLLGFVTKEIKPENFITIGWKLVDLSKINVSIKVEFNADNLEIYKKEAIIAEKWLEKQRLERFS